MLVVYSDKMLLMLLCVSVWVYLHICVQVCIHVSLCIYVHCIDGGGHRGREQSCCTEHGRLCRLRVSFRVARGGWTFIRLCPRRWPHKDKQFGPCNLVRGRYSWINCYKTTGYVLCWKNKLKFFIKIFLNCKQGKNEAKTYNGSL